MILLERIRKVYVSLPLTVKASFWFTVSSLFQKGLAFIVTPIYTRILTTEDYGIYSVYISWQSVITIFATLNLAAGVLNNSLLHEDRFGCNDDQILSNFQVIEMITIPVVMLGIIAIKLFIPAAINLPLKALIMMFVSIFFSSSMSLWAVKERYRFKYKWVTIVTIISSFLTVLINIASVVFGNDPSFALIYGSTVAIVICYLMVLINNLTKGKSFKNFDLWNYALKFNIPLIPHYLASSVLSGADKIMIDSYLSSSDAALYSVAYSLGNIIIVFVNAINSSLAPYTYQKLKEGNTEDIRRFTNTVYILLIIISVVVILLGPELIYILGGDKYLNAKWVIPPVAGAIVFFFMYPMFANVEFYYEKRIMTMVASVLAAIANVALNAIFIRKYGYVAAAYTTLVCYILLSLAHFFIYRIVIKGKKIGQVYDERRILLFSIITTALIVITNILYLNDTIRYIILFMSVISIGIFHKKISEVFKIIYRNK